MSFILEDRKKEFNIIETVSDEEMQNFFVWLNDNNVSVNYGKWLFEDKEIQFLLEKYRDEKKRG